VIVEVLIERPERGYRSGRVVVVRFDSEQYLAIAMRIISLRNGDYPFRPISRSDSTWEPWIYLQQPMSDTSGRAIQRTKTF